MSDHPANAEHVDLDDGNEAELAGHKITLAEAAQVLAGEPVWVRNKKGRAGAWLAVGRTAGGRRLSIVVAYDSIRRSARPITGWESTKGERDRYEVKGA